jgi:hypothetical protein
MKVEQECGRLRTKESLSNKKARGWRVQQMSTELLPNPHANSSTEVVVHACNPSYSGARGRRIIVVLDWPQAKVGSGKLK